MGVYRGGRHGTVKKCLLLLSLVLSIRRLLGIHSFQVAVFAQRIQRKRFCGGPSGQSRERRVGLTFSDVVAESQRLLDLVPVRQMAVFYLLTHESSPL